jgi:hypothetical protein
MVVGWAFHVDKDVHCVVVAQPVEDPLSLRSEKWFARFGNLRKSPACFRDRRRINDVVSMTAERTYSTYEIVHDCCLMEAIWEQIRHDLSDKFRVLTAYATCSALVDLIQLKIDRLEVVG